MRLEKKKSENAMKSLPLTKPITSLTVPDVMALFQWHDAPNDGHWERIGRIGIIIFM